MFSLSLPRNSANSDKILVANYYNDKGFPLQISDNSKLPLSKYVRSTISPSELTSKFLVCRTLTRLPPPAPLPPVPSSILHMSMFKKPVQC